MENKLYFLFLVSFFISCPLVYAQESQTITVGSESISYTETYNDLPNTTSYYNGDELILTEYDEDQNGAPDVWVLYKPNFLVEQEMRDSDGDGKPDIYYDLDQNENVIRAGGEGYEKYTAVPTPDVTENTTSGGNEVEVDYAGDLTDIEKLAGEGSNWWVWVLGMLLISVGGYIWVKKKDN